MPVTAQHLEGSPYVVAAYYRETWFTIEGARLKYARLLRRGLPDFRGWKFITLTLADHETQTPEAAHAAGSERLRRFTAKWRERLGHSVAWCWKLELHDDGFPHWHMLVDYRKEIPEEFLPEVAAWWGLGRVNVKQVRGESMHYLFKYVCKGSHDLPEWVLDHKGRIRCFQASSGFFVGRVRARKKSEAKRMSLLPLSLRTLFRWDRSKVIVRSWLRGRPVVRVFKCAVNFSRMQMQHVSHALRYRVTLPYSDRIEIGETTFENHVRNQYSIKGLGCFPCAVYS